MKNFLKPLDHAITEDDAIEYIKHDIETFGIFMKEKGAPPEWIEQSTPVLINRFILDALNMLKFKDIETYLGAKRNSDIPVAISMLEDCVPLLKEIRNSLEGGFSLDRMVERWGLRRPVPCDWKISEEEQCGRNAYSITLWAAVVILEQVLEQSKRKEKKA